MHVHANLPHCGHKAGHSRLDWTGTGLGWVELGSTGLDWAVLGWTGLGHTRPAHLVGRLLPGFSHPHRNGRFPMGFDRIALTQVFSWGDNGMGVNEAHDNVAGSRGYPLAGQVSPRITYLPSPRICIDRGGQLGRRLSRGAPDGHVPTRAVRLGHCSLVAAGAFWQAPWSSIPPLDVT